MFGQGAVMWGMAESGRVWSGLALSGLVRQGSVGWGMAEWGEAWCGCVR